MKDTIAKKVTSFDVARHAGVSRSAVSRAFTPGAHIADKTRKKVFESAQILGYQVNYLARDLKNTHSGFVGILANQIMRPYRAKQIALLTQKLLSVGYRPILLNTDSDATESMLNDLLGYRMAGFVVTSDTPPSHIVDKCHDFNIPVVFINRFYEQETVDRIELDFQQCGQIVFDMLSPPSGVSLGVVGIQEHSYSVQGRTKAFQDVCCQNNVPIREFLAIRQDYQSGLDIVSAIIESIEHSPLDGLFVATDLLALGVCDGLRHHNIRIPQDIQIVGFDNIEQASWLSYELSTVCQDLDWQMDRAVGALVNRIQNTEHPYETIPQKIKPVHRKTTRSQSD